MITDYGIPYLLRHTLRIYSTACRRTGRTSYALNQMDENSTFVTNMPYDFVKKMFRDRGVKGHFIIANSLEQAYNKLRGHHTKVVFDHYLLELHYEEQLKRMQEGVEEFIKVCAPTPEDKRDESKSDLLFRTYGEPVISLRDPRRRD